jgi:DNA processing protein
MVVRYDGDVDRRTEALYLLAVARNFQPRHHDLLVSQLGSLEAILDTTEDDLRHIELQAGHKQRLLEAKHGCDPVADLASLAAQGVVVVGWGHDYYPELLAQLPDAPLMLFCKGDAAIMRHHGVGIVGSRKCSSRGRQLAHEFGYQLAEVGVPVVSGMALGIDGAAHTGALEAPGPTVAVLGCGVDVIYPKQHHELYEQLVASGLVISEYPLGTEPRKEHFPQRNRIISGLSRGIIVAEAPMGSGALITARLAGEQGREVFALPGPIGSPYSRGTHDLIKRGRAKLVENVDDVLVEFGTNRAILRKERITAFQLPLDQHSRPEGSRDVAASSTAAGGLSAEEQQMLGALSYEGTHINDLVRKLGITTPDCIARLTMLEIKGLITAAGSGFYARL